MQLFYSANSTYARVARLALRDTGLITSCEEVLAQLRVPENPVLAHSPLGRVPTLVHGDLVLTETRIVFDYIMAQADPSHRVAGSESWDERAQDGLVFGFLEGIVAWIRENRRPQDKHMTFCTELEQTRAARVMHHLEQQAQKGALTVPPDYRAYLLAVALGLWDVHGFLPDWRDRYPALGAWFDRENAKPAMQATLPTTP